MRAGYDLRIIVECISDDKILKGLLTKGNKYTAIRKLNIGDFKVECDDNGDKELYKCEYFKVVEIIECNYDIRIGDTFNYYKQ